MYQKVVRCIEKSGEHTQKALKNHVKTGRTWALARTDCAYRVPLPTKAVALRPLRALYGASKEERTNCMGYGFCVVGVTWVIFAG